jgi:hypothetical protein
MAMFSYAAAADHFSKKDADKKDLEARDLARKDKLISLILPELLDRRDKKTALLQAASSRISYATIDLGMDQEAAAILEATGQLEVLNTRLKELKEDPDRSISGSALRQLSEGLIRDLAPEKIAAAMDYAIGNDFLDAPSTTKYIEALYASSSDDILTTAAELESGTRRRAPRPNIGRIDFNELALTEQDPKKRATMVKILSTNLSPHLGGTASVNETGQIITSWEKPAEAQKVIQNATDYFIAQSSDVFNTKSEIEILEDIYDLTGGYIASTGDIAKVAQIDFGTPPSDITPSTNPIIPTGNPEQDLQIPPPISTDETDDDIINNNIRPRG